MIRILNGDCRSVLATLPDASVQCCVTSPPYFGLRDYGVDGQIGLEASPEAFVAEMVAVFREVRRGLRDDGTLWLNLGDSYCHDTKWGGSSSNKNELQQGYARPQQRRHSGAKPKDLIGIPWLVAFALRADGWWLRKDIIWAKPNPMPESATDRPTSSHEHVFLLAKSERYFFDAEAVREGRTGDEDARTFRGDCYVGGEPGKRGVVGNKRVKVPGGWDQGAGAHGTIHRDGRTEATYQEAETKAGRNIRDVWTIATSPFPEAHFATFPPELAERCIKAGTSEKGCCAACGTPWRREVQTISFTTRPNSNGIRGQAASSRVSGSPQRGARYADHTTTGWHPSCTCAAAVVPCTILDPFAGAFTSLMVADRLQRDGIGIELNPDYCEMARKRLTRDAGLFASLATQ